MTHIDSPIDIVTDATLGPLLHRLAAAQDAEGTRLSDETWVWVAAFADFDYEYAYLLDVRQSTGTSTVSDYLALFQGYDNHGVAMVRAAWWDHQVTFPEVPNLYDAMAWWAGWVRETREGGRA